MEVGLLNLKMIHIIQIKEDKEYNGALVWYLTKIVKIELQQYSTFNP